MKKVTFLAAVIVAASFASCKKTHTCTCTETDSTGTSTQVYSLGKQKKKDAESTCTSYQTTLGWTSCKLD